MYGHLSWRYMMNAFKNQQHVRGMHFESAPKIFVPFFQNTEVFKVIRYTINLHTRVSYQACHCCAYE